MAGIRREFRPAEEMMESQTIGDAVGIGTNLLRRRVSWREKHAEQ
jgi:hypothetical protein